MEVVIDKGGRKGGKMRTIKGNGRGDERERESKKLREGRVEGV